MQKHYIFLLIILLSSNLVASQNINGKIYDDEATVKGAKIKNVSKNISTYSNDDGDFKINAAINDSLQITSLFHDTKILKVTNDLFNETIVIELKKAVNNLDEVLLSSEKEKQFDKSKYKADLGEQIKNDMKNNLHLYAPTAQSAGIDLIKVAQLIGKLFKKKKEIPIVFLDYTQIDSLFNTANHPHFNEKFLATELKIPMEYIPLFFDYCDAQNFEKSLLLDENEFLLLSKFITCGEGFLKILDEAKTDTIKD